MSKKPWRRISHDDEKRLRYLTTKRVPLADIAFEFGMSKSWVCQRQKEFGMVSPSKVPIFNGLSADDISTLSLHAENRGTDLLGLCTAILEVIAREPFLIDAILDDDKEPESTTHG